MNPIFLAINITGIVSHPVFLVSIFLVSTVVGYMLIKNVPSLLHTPLMSGMNALSGITVIGAIVATGLSFSESPSAMIVGQIVGGLAIILAMVNVVGGFMLTHRMLRMFNKKKKVK